MLIVSVQPTSHPLIPAEIDAEMTPAVRAFVHALIAAFQSQINVLQSQIVDLNSKIADLESQVRKLTPQNSSVPPSSVHPHGKAPRGKPKSGKNRGGQKGHPRHQRKRSPPAGVGSAGLTIGTLAFLLGGDDSLGPRYFLPVRLVAAFFLAVGADRFRVSSLPHVRRELRVVRLPIQ